MLQYQKPVITQEQKLKMNPQLYQSIQLMALPIQELRFRIQEELEKNPALEVIKDDSSVSLDEAPSKQAEEYEYFENSSDPGYTRSLDKDAADQKRKFIEGTPSRPESLQDHLAWQLRLQPISQDWFEVGMLLIRNLDENGFHREKPETLLEGRDFKDLNGVMKLIQGLEPVGVCTADYHESLKVQAERAPEAPERTVELLENYFTLLERGRLADIARKMKLTETEVEKIVAFIKILNPFPGRLYSNESPTYVIPDLMVKIKDGEFVLILNDEEIPVLGINSFFAHVLDKKERKKEAGLKSYVNASLNSARWFIRSIKQRNETLVKIARAIIELQRDFFLKGPKYLAPLTLKDIAGEVGVHETTVSRIANSKYIQTEWGIFELKYFFSNSISGAGSTGSRFSKGGVKEIIKEIIENDHSGKHLSDQKIADILKSRGINLARRTVAKYRNELDISSSYRR
ncbi:MAG: RNA polymerase factor sigma-54 [Spirochaetota bacterium]